MAEDCAGWVGSHPEQHFVASKRNTRLCRWDLRKLQEELTRVLGEVDKANRPYVPSELHRALDMFLDSYER